MSCRVIFPADDYWTNPRPKESTTMATPPPSEIRDIEKAIGKPLAEITADDLVLFVARAQVQLSELEVESEQALHLLRIRQPAGDQ